MRWLAAPLSLASLVALSMSSSVPRRWRVTDETATVDVLKRNASLDRFRRRRRSESLAASSSSSPTLAELNDVGERAAQLDAAPLDAGPAPKRPDGDPLHDALKENAPAPKPADLHDMVPITHELLSEHYAKFPNPHINPQLLKHRDDISELQVMLMARVAAPANHAQIAAILTEQLPTGLDNSMYCIRCACEEAAERTSQTPPFRDFSPRFVALAEKFERFQECQRDHVSALVNEFLPQDFRGTIFTAARQRSERANQQAIDELVAAGGSVRDKYNLLWEQQWKRRESLAMIGNASGIWRWLVRYLAGVPEPLLTFAKNINSPHGPTDVLRVKFGSALAELAKFAIELNALCAALTFANGADDFDKVAQQLEASLLLYEAEVDKFVTLLQEVITHSPFFVRPDQIAQLKSSSE